MIKNNLKINDSKIEFLVLTSSFFKQQFNDLPIDIGIYNTQIKSTASARNLIIFDSHSKIYLRNIGSVRNMLSADGCSQLIHAIERSCYCSH